MYFERNIPYKMPSHMREHNRKAWEAMARRVNARMLLLESALDLSGMRGEDFSAAISSCFDKNTDDPSLDSMSAQELAEIASLHAPLVGHQPDRMDWPNCDVVVDTAFTTTKEWEMIRSMGLGGSEAAIVMESSPYSTRQSLYHLKVGTKLAWEPEDSGKDFIFAYGHCVESLVVDTFCNITGAKVVPETRMFRHRKYPFITANMDAVVKIPANSLHPNEQVYIFEAKTTSNQAAWYEGKVPPHYVPQCRQYMAVLDDPRVCSTYIGCIWGNTRDCFAARPIERDLALEQVLISEEISFWQDHVQAHREPEFSGKPEMDTEMIRKLSGEADKTSSALMLSSDLESAFISAAKLDREIAQLKTQMDSKKEERDRLLTPVKDAMGKATTAILNGTDHRWSVKWNPIKRRTADLDRLELVYPEVYNDVVSVNIESSRRFSYK